MKNHGIMTAAFLLMLFCVGAASGYAFFDTNTVSESENRTLAKAPELSEESWFSGEFASGMETFLSDHVFRRSDMLSLAQTIESAMERKGAIKIVTHDAADMAGNAADDIKKPDAEGGGEDSGNTPGGSVELNGDNAGENAEQERIVLEDRILLCYSDAEDALSYYAKVANKFFDMFPDYVNKYCLLAPSRIAFEEEDVARYSDDQRAAIDYAYDKLDPIVTTVDAYSALYEHAERLDDLYYRTDHHWTHLGAYYAYAAMAEEAGLACRPLSEYSRNEGNTFLGYFYAQDPDPEIAKHEDELIYYLPTEHPVPKCVLYIPTESGELESENAVTVNPMRGGYYTFAGSAFAYSVMDGAKDDGGCILMVSDSYGNAFGTWLAENFATVIQIDPRDFTLGREGVLALYEEYGVTDVMICDYLASVNTSYFPAQIEHLTE